MNMNTIKKEITNEIIINKSKFITILTNISSKEEIITKINNIKKEYKDATHYCYAYIIDNQKNVLMIKNQVEQPDFLF